MLRQIARRSLQRARPVPSHIYRCAFFTTPPRPQSSSELPSSSDFITRYHAAQSQPIPSVDLSDFDLTPSRVPKHKTRLTSATFVPESAELELEFAEEAESTRKTSHERVSTLWLRDSCPCAQCVDPHSGQKTFSTTDLPDEPLIQEAAVLEDGGLRVVWAPDENPTSPTSDHTAIWPASTLPTWHSHDQTVSPHLIPSSRIPWDRDTYSALLPRCTISFSDWTSRGTAFQSAFSMLIRTGLIVITSVPTTESSVELVAGAIGELQHTFYGLTWDVRSKPAAENVAYTNTYLGLHADLMYMTDPPRLQFLHCLENSCDGGESLFGDGLRAAVETKIRTGEKGGAWDVLTQPMVNFHYTKNANDRFQTRPTITQRDGRVEGVHWAPPFQGPFDRPLSTNQLLDWKKAAAAFKATLEAEENMVSFRLQPGDCVVFDNMRALHGRKAFNTSTGSRWLKGAYVSGQTFQAAVNRIGEEGGCGMRTDTRRERREAGGREEEVVVRRMCGLD